MSGYMEACQYCNDKKCDGCPLPFNKDLTYNDLLIKLGVDSNVSFYNDSYKRGKSDVIFDIVWHQKVDK